jgi:hypothetical protein
MLKDQRAPLLRFDISSDFLLRTKKESGSSSFISLQIFPQINLEGHKALLRFIGRKIMTILMS